MTDGADNVMNIEDWKDSSKGQDFLLEKCIIKIAKGKIDYMKDLYDQTSTSVYGLALSILKNPDDAKDVLHDCFLKIHRGASGYSSGGKPLAWIFTITKNLCIQKIRENSKMADIPEDQSLEDYLKAENDMSVEDSMIIKECLTVLNDDERQIVVLHAVSGYKHKDIADFMEMPLPTVLSKYNRALKKLKERITKGGTYDE